MSVQCIEPIKDNFDHEANENLNMPADCALGLVDTAGFADNSKLSGLESNLAVVTDLDKVRVRCVACKPGFKATRGTFNNDPLALYVSACTTI